MKNNRRRSIQWYWGFECYNEALDGVYPSDIIRIQRVKELIEAGYLKHLLFSHDICVKIQLTKYGGYGYAHILREIVPILKREGVKDEEVHTILVENPKELLKRE